MPQTKKSFKLSLVKPMIGIATLAGILLGTSLHPQARKFLLPASQATDIPKALLENEEEQVIVAEVHQQINQYRASLDLPPLELHPQINQQATAHSYKMAQGLAEFSHQGFKARVGALANAIAYRSAAENLGFNQGYQDPATIAVEGWIDSESHRLNMVGDYNLTGIGVVKNDQGEYYFTQIFIKEQ